MRRSILLACAAAAMTPSILAAQPPTGIEDPLTVFEQVCMASNAKGQQAIARSREHGFVKPPNAMIGSLTRSAQIPNALASWRVFEGGFAMVVAGEGPIPFDDDTAGDLCAVVWVPQDSQITSRAQAALDLPKPQETKDGLSLYYYEDRDEKHRSISGSSILAVSKAIEAGRLRILISGSTEFESNEKASMLMLMIPRARQHS
jgi:hypothetical protein